MLSSKRIKDSIKDYPINEYPIKINFELYERLRHYLAFTCVNRSLRNHIDVKNILDDSDDLKSLNNSTRV